MRSFLPRLRLPISLGGGYVPRSPVAEGRARPVDAVDAGTSVLSGAPNLAQVRDLLRLIAGEKCSQVWGGGRCWESPWLTPNCGWSADRWCDACIAQAALDALTSSSPKENT